MGLEFNKHTGNLFPLINPSTLNIEKIKINGTQPKYISIIQKVLNPIIKSIFSNSLKSLIVEFIPQVVSGISKIEFDIPYVGIYHTEFTSAPWITKYGLIASMGILKGGINSTTPPIYIQKDNDATKNQMNIPLRKYLKRNVHSTARSRSSFAGSRPTSMTSIQPFITPVLFTKLNPIIFKSVTALIYELLPTLDFAVINKIPLLGEIHLNASSFKLHGIQWGPDSGLSLGENVLRIDSLLNLNISLMYETNSILSRNGELSVNIQDCKIQSELGFLYNSNNQTWSPFFKIFKIDFKHIGISSSTVSYLGPLNSLFNPLCRKIISSNIESAIKAQVPPIIRSIFETKIEIPYAGIFRTHFLKAPEIRNDGMLVDLNLA